MSKLKVTTSQLVNLLAFADKLKKLQQTREKTAEIDSGKFYCEFKYGKKTTSNYLDYDSQSAFKLTQVEFLAILDAQIAKLVDEFNGGQGDLEVVTEGEPLEFPSLGTEEGDED